MLRVIASLLLLVATAGRAADIDGTLDTTFGDQGRAVVGFLDHQIPAIGALVLGNSDRTYLVGAPNGLEIHHSLLIVRLVTSTGLPDTTFGPLGDGRRETDLPAGLRAAVVRGSRFTPSGKLLVWGSVDNDTDVDLAFVCQLFVAGNLDVQFGNGGCRTMRTFIAGETTCYARDVAVDSTGRLAVVGYCLGEFPFVRAFIARLTAGGALDTDFAGGAGLITPLVPGPYTAEQRFESAQIVAGDGIAVAATMQHVGGDTDVAIVQFDQGGSFDSAFNGNGVRSFAFDLGEVPATREDYAQRVLRRADGRLVLVTESRKTNFDAHVVLAQVSATGAPDTSFGIGGVAVDSRVVLNVFPFLNWLTSRRAHAFIDDRERIVVAAFASTFGGDSDDYITRYRANGTPDPGFGGGEPVLVDHQAVLEGPNPSEEFTVGVAMSGTSLIVASFARRPDVPQHFFLAYALRAGELFRDSFE